MTRAEAAAASLIRPRPRSHTPSKYAASSESGLQARSCSSLRPATPSRPAARSESISSIESRYRREVHAARAPNASTPAHKVASITDTRNRR